MSVIRVGSTGKYADGWEQIFGGVGGGRGRKAGAKRAAAGKAKKATRTKASAPKQVKKKPGTKRAKSRRR